MNDRELDRLLHRAQPGAGRVVGSLDLSGGERELLEQIMATPDSLEPGRPRTIPSAPDTADDAIELGPLQPVSPEVRSGRVLTGRRVLAGLAVAAAFAAAVVVPRTVLGSADGGAAATPAAVTPVATRPVPRSGNPYLLLPGWTVTHVQEYSAGQGEVRFELGAKSLDVSWLPAAQYAAADDKVAGDPGAGEVEFLDRTGRMAGENGRTPAEDGSFMAVLPPRGGSFLIVSGVVPERTDFVGALGGLVSVDKQDWWSALPESVVLPNGREAAVKQMLTGVPQPDGFEVGPLFVTNLDGFKGADDWYQVAARVVARVSCAWIGEYREGDPATKQAAATALGGSADWAVVERMAEQGDYPEMLQRYADLVTGGKTVPDAYTEELGCPVPLGSTPTDVASIDPGQVVIVPDGVAAPASPDPSGAGTATGTP